MRRIVPILWMLMLYPFLAISNATAETAADIDADVDAALRNLYREAPSARALSDKANAILVFPRIVKAGLLVGGQFGNGALRKEGKPAGYYRTAAVSYGLQAGAQTFGYALFFMTADSTSYLDRSDGWEIGIGPSVVVVDEGMARTLSSTTLKDDIYAFIFGQKGLMAGLGVQGSKITRINPD